MRIVIEPSGVNVLVMLQIVCAPTPTVRDRVRSCPLDVTVPVTSVPSHSALVKTQLPAAAAAGRVSVAV